VGSLAGNFVELFSSVQGEGPHVGASTLFVRLGVCDLRCRWCDSPHTWQAAEACRIQVSRGSAEFREIANPVPVAAIVAAAEALDLASHAFVSLTGGEPLLQPEVVRALAQVLRGRGPRIHLETHGLAHEALAQVVDVVDLVAMDWKLASDVRREGESFKEAGADFHDAHEAFLRVARRAPEAFVKIVITASSRDDEVLEAARRIARVDPRILLVLQPVTPRGSGTERPSAARLLALAAAAEAILPGVRVIPQTHPIYGAP
jgi:organic radical activating enzyme